MNEEAKRSGAPSLSEPQSDKILLMVILVDMDEVLADFEGRLLELWNEKYPHTPLFPESGRDAFYIGSGENHGRWDLVQQIIHKEGFFVKMYFYI